MIDETLHQTVRVDLGERAYDIVIGPGVLAETGTYLATLAPGTRCAVVTDENVAALHLDAVRASLSGAGFEPGTLVLPAGEATKDFGHLRQTVEALLDARLERGDLVVALGGGVIGDLTGFAAAVTRRGMGFVQIPTSLLAQVDSSVGGKTGINAPQGKNLVGAFYQPRIVIADTAVLDTLPVREFRAGYAEVAKYGLINDAPFFSWLEDNLDAITAGGPARTQAIAASCRAKAAIVARDEREAGERALLNLGHTFGHALEGITGYRSDVLVHGEGVAIGLVLAHAFSARMNLCSPDDVKRVTAHLETAGLPTDLTPVRAHVPDADALMDFIAQDKKVSRGALTFILTRGIGEAFIADDVPASEVRAFLQQMLES
ncbi:3-dehydroquinate synthase [Oceaniradius stylonematis]|jgi:3-dehydroquinate synthase|uniref:3-dehydroquinate synthase n=1 Tax=Oceaniradius stylonematis TaxID=2184161 RepID=A0A3A8AAJ4_9HYPH|nr:3-dehydroquinate synthase [Oceaniradius stylonematis]RKF07352.1 3-dehydroquinate synthase [Oceaniradius stylonematis]RNC96703.1 MAG: 3-dehydroquinate synthase [Oricola sp.]